MPLADALSWDPLDVCVDSALLMARGGRLSAVRVERLVFRQRGPGTLGPVLAWESFGLLVVRRGCASPWPNGVLSSAELGKGCDVFVS